MVARRGKQREHASALEAAEAALAAVGSVGEADMARRWGPNWKQDLQRAREAAAAGQGEFFANDEEFLASLEE